MSKKRPPRLSDDLLARLAEGYILSSRKGRPYLKRYASPKNPRTPGQRSARFAFARAVHAWQAADPAIKARWNEAAHPHDVDPVVERMGDLHDHDRSGQADQRAEQRAAGEILRAPQRPAVPSPGPSGRGRGSPG